MEAQPAQAPLAAAVEMCCACVGEGGGLGDGVTGDGHQSQAAVEVEAVSGWAGAMCASVASGLWRLG